MKKVLPTLILIFLFFSCEKTTDFKIEELEKKLVVNCIFSPDSIWKVNVSHTISPTDIMQFESIENADISIYMDNNLLCKLDTYIKPENEFIFPYYTSQDYKVPNNLNSEFTIKVKHKEYDSIFAISQIPKKPILKNIEIEKISLTESNFSELYVLDATIELTIDDPLEENFYFLNFYYKANYTKAHYDYIDTSYIDIISHEFRANEASVENFFTSNIPILINDSTFDGQEQKYILDIGWGLHIKEMEDFDKFWVELTSLHSDNYLYIKSLAQQYITLNDPYSEPTIVYSNITNGYGIFTATNSIVDTIYINNINK